SGGRPGRPRRGRAGIPRLRRHHDHAGTRRGGPRGRGPTMSDAVQALRSGEPVVLPFDTVYGLAADPTREEPTQRLYELKGREQTEPSALVARDFDFLLECIPELRGAAASLARLLLP